MRSMVIHRLLEDAVGRHPERVAMRTAAGTITYRNLNENADQLAAQLVAGCRTQNGDLVALYVRPGVLYVTAMLATLKAGGVFVPIDSEIPVARRRMLIEKVKPALALTTADQLGSWMEIGSPVPTVQISPTSPATVSTGPTEVTGEDGCYVMFTSGSTGEPKAILGSHKGLSHFVEWEIGEFGIDETCRVPQLAPVTFDVSLRDMLVPLCAGGTLCVPPPAVLNNVGRLIEWLDSEVITHIHCVPSLFRALTHELRLRGGCPTLRRTLRQILLAGEPLYPDDIHRWRSVMGQGTELVNLYGPSETTLAKAFNRLGDVFSQKGCMVPVGKPLPNTALLIVQDGELCDHGEIGEVYIRTPFMSKGYLDDPGRTAQAFVRNPLTLDAADIVYRTGDLGRYGRDDSVELLGRQDNQVKVHGVRIELEEVERAMLSHPLIDQAVVVAHSTADQEVCLAAYYLSARSVQVEILREHLGSLLPAVMIPTFFMRMEQFPTNLHGKVNRRALPRPAELLYRDKARVAPVGEIETAISEIFDEVLQIGTVSAVHKFVELGGSSLKAIRVLPRIAERFQVEVRLQELFPEGTVQSVASVVAKRRSGQSSEGAAL